MPRATLSPKQKVLAGWGTTPTDKPRTVASVGAIRSGKTWSAALGLFLYTATMPPLPPGYLHLLVGRKVSVIEEAIVAPMRGFADDAGIPSRYDRGRSMLHIGDQQYKLLAGENILSEAAPMGFSACCALIDEASLLSEDFVNRILSRVTMPNGKVWMCANPTAPTSWLKKRIDDGGTIDRSLHFTLNDNPTLAESNRAFYRGLFAGADYTRLVEGEWAVASGAIFPQFTVVKEGELPTAYIEEVLVAVDVGYAVPYAAVYGARTRLDNLLIYDEYYFRPEDGERTPREHAKAVIARQRENMLGADWPDASGFYVDPAAAGDVAEYRSMDCYLPSVKKDVLAGIACLRVQLEKPTIYILERCERLIEELQGYVYDEKKAARGEDGPVKENDHAVDALRYLASGVWNLDAYSRYV